MPFVRGNHKLGTKIVHWSLPAVSTCPGRSALCESHCYGGRGFYCFSNTSRALKLNYKLSRSRHFVSWANLELKILRPDVVRIHADGDFYSAEYVNKWLAICRANPRITFYAYSRSWRVPEIRAQLVKLSRLRNVSLWFSVDKETGVPQAVPSRVHLAYMQVAEEDLPAEAVDLVFRVNRLRKVVKKKVEAQDGSLAMVCPPENGVTKTTCEQCKVCYRDALPAPSRPGRLALSLV